MSSPQSPNFTNHKFQDSCLIFNGESLEKYLEIFSQSFFTGGCFSPTGTWSLVVGKILKIFEYTYVENTLEIFENVFENIKIYFDFLIFFRYLIAFVLLFDGRMLLSDWHLVSGCGRGYNRPLSLIPRRSHHHIQPMHNVLFEQYDGITITANP